VGNEVWIAIAGLFLTVISSAVVTSWKLSSKIGALAQKVGEWTVRTNERHALWESTAKSLKEDLQTANAERAALRKELHKQQRRLDRHVYSTSGSHKAAPPPDTGNDHD
jgi:hypothetical protein